jgi:hypothetical protein
MCEIKYLLLFLQQLGQQPKYCAKAHTLDFMSVVKEDKRDKSNEIGISLFKLGA